MKQRRARLRKQTQIRYLRNTQARTHLLGFRPDPRSARQRCARRERGSITENLVVQLHGGPYSGQEYFVQVPVLAGYPEEINLVMPDASFGGLRSGVYKGTVFGSAQAGRVYVWGGWEDDQAQVFETEGNK
jgi:hypothetical protein